VTRTRAAVEEYIHGGAGTVDGWLFPIDAWMFVAAGHATRDEPGDLLEIGCYLGKTAILLGYLGNLTVVDLFEDPAPSAEQQAEQARWYQGFTQDAFLANYRRFHARPPAVLQGRSDERLPELADGSARLIHVDGAHAFDAVSADIVQCCRIATRSAIIAFDDVLTPHTPGVTAAVWKAIHDRGLVPLAQTNAKLYATLPESTVTAASFAEAIVATTPVRVLESHVVAGSPILEPSYRPLQPSDTDAPPPPLWRRIARRLLRAVRFGA
jgi:hypothetical protein